ncbi:unnamed protein product [Ambrosiozyma monospora]|uniref:Unnamed protein product n=1 Tax=Ambrosiozyma monospora TaxID=43982 RepID=A0A9W7DJC4_AMBMO|nr:unnamed protein product [Ambrosiozyma monospora]
MPLFRKDHHSSKKPPPDVTSTKPAKPKPNPQSPIISQKDDSDSSLYKTMSETSTSDTSIHNSRSRSSSMSQKFKSLFNPHAASSASLHQDTIDLSSSPSSPNSSAATGRGPVRHSLDLKNGHIQKYPVPNRQPSVRKTSATDMNKDKDKTLVSLGTHPKQQQQQQQQQTPQASVTLRSPPSSPVISIDQAPLTGSSLGTGPGSASSNSIPPLNNVQSKTPSPASPITEINESLNKLKFMPPVIENDLDEVLEGGDLSLPNSAPEILPL